MLGTLIDWLGERLILELEHLGYRYALGYTEKLVKDTLDAYVVTFRTSSQVSFTFVRSTRIRISASKILSP